MDFYLTTTASTFPCFLINWIDILDYPVLCIEIYSTVHIELEISVLRGYWQGRRWNVNWGGYIHIFMFCQTNFF